MTRSITVYETVEQIRSRPAMYLGQCARIRLRAFLEGRCFINHEFGIPYHAQPDFGDFHDWVARRFVWRQSTAGWCNAMLEECGGDDRKALDTFFGLVEEVRRSVTPEKGTWAVRRQDDNGDRFVVETGLSQEEAERLVAELEARGHKQVYWAEPEQSRQP